MLKALNINTTSHSYQNSFIQAGSLKSNSDSLLLSGANVSANASLGSGSIIVGGQTQSEQQLADLGVNQDLDKAQEMTLDQKTGGLNASVTVDHRLLSEDGLNEVKEEVKAAASGVSELASGVENLYKDLTINLSDEVAKGLNPNNPKEAQAFFDAIQQNGVAKLGL